MCGAKQYTYKILHLIKAKVSIPLSELVNKSFSTGCSSNLCKTAKVIPIFKTESNFFLVIIVLFLSCRISIKLLKNIMHQRLNKFLDETNCFYNWRFGYRLNLSTNNALLSIIEIIQTDLDNGDFATGVFIDLKKASDKSIMIFYSKSLNSKVWEDYRETSSSPT